MNEMTNEQTTITNNDAAKVPEGIEDKKEDIQNTERMFTQKELEEILKDRLIRERKQNESLSEVRKVLKSAQSKGVLKSSSYSDIAKELYSILVKDKDSQDTEADENTASVAAEDGKTLTADNAMAGVDTHNEKDNDTSFIEVLSRIKAKYPQSSVEKMLAGDLFERFAKGRNGSICDIFDDYYGFMSRVGGIKEEEQTPYDEGGLYYSSTAFSSEHSVPQSGTNLTKQQMDIAKSAGMSYREYQNLLESIPKRTGRTF